jgi:prepilin signal peptidase PulO-like enzyme (type II secretory pathway)
MSSIAVSAPGPAHRVNLHVVPFAAVFAIAGAILASRTPDWHHAVVLLMGLGLCGWVACIDLQSLRAPNVITYPAAMALTIGAFTLGSAAGLQALAGGGAAFTTLLIAALLGRGAMGFGDVKFGYTFGALVGIHGLLPALLLAFGGGGAFALALIAARVRTRKDVVAFTPFLALGAAGALIVSGGYLLR